MAFWLDIAAFLVKALIIVAALGGLAVLIARLARSGEPKEDQEIKVLPCDPGCHGVNWGAKKGGGYYGYVGVDAGVGIELYEVGFKEDGLAGP